jgi:DNA-binding CsgD family transcriptional regulator
MTAPVRVSGRDLRSLAGIVSADRLDLPEAGVPLSLLSDLMTQVPCDLLTFSGQDTRREELWYVQDLPAAADSGEDGDDDKTQFWCAYRACAHCAYPDSGDLRSITQTSDFYSARQWHSTRMYADQVFPGIEHMLMLCLPFGPGPDAKPGPGPDLRLVLLRGRGPDFSERDRALLALLRPHLRQAYRDAERRRHPAHQLTPRQWELLRLVAAGHTNAQIARQLGVSEGTVRIHLQNIYTRLQVPNRTAAVTRAFPDLAAT